MILCLATVYLSVAAYGFGTRHFLLVPLGLILAVVIAWSGFWWLSPTPPKRPWMGWCWIPLAVVPFAVGLFFRWQGY
jgi:hypothetical protein